MKLDIDKIKQKIAESERNRRLEDQNQDDRDFSSEQIAGLRDTIQGAVLYLLDNLDQSKEVSIKGVVAAHDKQLESTNKKLDALKKSIDDQEPTDLKPLIEATEKVSKAVESIPEPKDIEIPQPIDYGPIFKHLSGQLDKLNKKDYSPEFKPEISVESPAVNVDVDLSELKEEQQRTNEVVSQLAKAVSAQPVFPVQEFMYYLKEIHQSLDLLARRPAVVGGGGGGGGGTTTTTPTDPDDAVDNLELQNGDDLLLQDGSFLLTQ